MKLHHQERRDIMKYFEMLRQSGIINMFGSHPILNWTRDDLHRFLYGERNDPESIEREIEGEEEDDDDDDEYYPSFVVDKDIKYNMGKLKGNGNTKGKISGIYKNKKTGNVVPLDVVMLE